MSKKPTGSLARRLRQEGGQVLPFTALLMVVLVGFAGLVIDVGRVWIAQRQLQNAVDATAVAVARNMPNDYAGWCQSAGATASVDCASLAPPPPPLGFSGVTGGENALFGYGVTAGQPTVTFACSPNAPGFDPNTNTCPADASTQDQPANLCQPGDSLPPQPAGNVGCNAVTVAQTATVKSTFAAVFSFAQFTLSANATATAPQTAEPTPLNVEVILDTTGSMAESCQSPVTGIPSNRTEKIDCAKAGVRALLSGLAPCDYTPQHPTCTGNNPNPGNELGANVDYPLDEVGLLTYPALRNVSDRPREIDCTNNQISVGYPTRYPPPSQPQPGYDIIGLSSDYRTANEATTLNPASDFVKAMWWTQCPGGVYPQGDYYGLQNSRSNTYLAGAIAEAQYQLSQAAARPDVQNVIIVLSDGELNDVQFFSGAGDSNPCQSAATAASAVKAAGTLIYAIAYDSHRNCTDSSGAYRNRPGLQLMENIATPNTGTDTYFYNQPAAGDLTNIFSQIAQALGIRTRIIPGP